MALPGRDLRISQAHAGQGHNQGPYSGAFGSDGRPLPPGMLCDRASGLGGPSGSLAFGGGQLGAQRLTPNFGIGRGSTQMVVGPGADRTSSPYASLLVAGSLLDDERSSAAPPSGGAGSPWLDDASASAGGGAGPSRAAPHLAPPGGAGAGAGTGAGAGVGNGSFNGGAGGAPYGAAGSGLSWDGRPSGTQPFPPMPAPGAAGGKRWLQPVYINGPARERLRLSSPRCTPPPPRPAPPPARATRTLPPHPSPPCCQHPPSPPTPTPTPYTPRPAAT